MISLVLSIETDQEAQAFFTGHVEYLHREHGLPLEEARDVARQNIGWCFGEGMSLDQRAMWRTVCQAYHPVFGEMRTNLTPTEMFEAGVRLASEGGQFSERLKKMRRSFDPPTMWERLSKDNEDE